MGTDELVSQKVKADVRLLLCIRDYLELHPNFCQDLHFTRLGKMSKENLDFC